MTDKSVVEQIKHYQRDIIKCPENAKRMIRCIERLMVLPVTIAHLQETGVGRSVNELRKCGGEVGAAANALVCKWKSMVQAEADSDAESEVEEDLPKETLQVSSPDSRSSPSIKNDSYDKHKKNKDSTDSRKQKTDLSHKKRESSNSDIRSDKYEHKSHKPKPSKSDQGSGSDSKHSSNHTSKSVHVSKSSHKSHSSHRPESERNGDTKTEKSSSKSKDDTKVSKSRSSESRNNDIKHNNYKDKRRKEESSSGNEKENRRKEDSSHRSVSSSSKKYDVGKIDSDSSDDDEIYKPKSKKRKKSESEDDRKSELRSHITSESEEDVKQRDTYSGHHKHKELIKKESSEGTNTENSSEEEENSRPSSRHSITHNTSENNDDSRRSSPNNMSDNEADSDSKKSSSKEDEDSHSDKASDSDEKEDSHGRELYVPTKIKREKESPPRHYKPSSAKDKSDHSKSSLTSSHHKHSNHSASHSSEHRSTHGKASSNKKEVGESNKIKKEREDSRDLKKRKEENPGDKKVYRSSNSHSDSPTKGSSSSKAEKKAKVKVEKESDGSIDCVSGASFADALMGLSEPKKKSLKRKPMPSSPGKSFHSSEKSSAEGKSKNPSKSEPRKSEPCKSESSSSTSSTSSKTSFKEPELLSKSIKLEPLDVDLKATLPEISPHYKPLPHYSPPSSPANKRTKQLTQEEALSTIMSTKNQRTKVYSGNKTGYLKVPSLFELCIQVLRDNIEALEYTGGVPYDLLKPVLDRATAAQLFQLEHYNPYLVEDTDGLWKFHCNKDFRGKEPDEFESWRELYVRLLDERERKLEALKANITQSMAKNTPVRQTKLAYVDSVVKPPRNIAKKQMKFGTAKAVKHDLVSKAMVGAAGSAPAPAAVAVPAPPASARGSSQSNAFPIPNFLKKKKAPLMQKTLQLIKGNRFKR